MKTITAILVAALGFTFAHPASAQSYPSRPVRVISPFPPGGGSDVVARIVVQAFSEQTGQQFIVDSRGGASGRIGTELAARAAADGYTLLLGNLSPQAILPAAGAKLPYDPVRDFAPIGLVATADYVLAVHPSLPAKSLPQLIALAKANEDKLTFASSGSLGAPHLAGELLNVLAGLKLLHVPYKGTGPAAIGVLTGESAMMFGSAPSVMPHAMNKALRVVATTGKKRSLPEIPTFAETIPEYVMTQWYGLLAPAGISSAVVSVLSKESGRMNANPGVRKAYAGAGIQATSSTPEEFGAFIKSEITKWSKVIQAAKLVGH